MSGPSGTVGLLHYPLGEDGGLAAADSRTPRRAYARAIAYRANARSPQYMAALLEETHPGSSLVRTTDPGWEERVAAGGRVVLLYPDSIGLGWTSVERRVRKLGAAHPTAVNGRRRSFGLDGSTLVALRARRFLERSMLGEAVALTLLALATPALAGWDLLRGRR